MSFAALLALPAFCPGSGLSGPATSRAARAPSMILRDVPSVRVPSSSSRLCDSLLEHFAGHFDNHAQVAANEAAGLAPRHGGGHEHIHCTLRPVPVHGTRADAHVLASYYFDGQPGSVFRERLYAFDALPADPQFGTCVRMAIYKLRPPVTAQLRAAGGVAGYSADDVAFTAAADLADDLHVPGADVFWRRSGERFEGHMRSDAITIVSERSGRPMVVRDDVTLWSDALWVNDRGHDAATGEYVYGNIRGVPYKLARVADDHWTASGAGPL